MFDVGFWEMVFIGVIALVVIGPERLPGVAKYAGHWIGKARRTAAEVKAELKQEIQQHNIDAVRELRDELSATTADLENIAKSATDIRDTVSNSENPIKKEDGNQHPKDSV